jgi:hypothetical protein
MVKKNTLIDFEAALDEGDLPKAISILRNGGAASEDEIKQLCDTLEGQHSDDAELKEFFPRRLVLIGRTNGRPPAAYFQQEAEAAAIAAQVQEALKVEGKVELAMERVAANTGKSLSTIKRCCRRAKSVASAH